MRNHVVVALTVCLSFVSAAVNADEDARRAALVAQLEQVMQNGPAIPGTPEIAARDLIIDVYEHRGFALNWTDPGKIEQLLVAIRATEADGLDPADYHLDFVEGIARERRSGAPLSVGDSIAIRVRSRTIIQRF